MPKVENERRETAAANSAAPNARDAARGYGACSKSGCNCKGYEGSGNTCANSGCGHAYSDHW